MLVITCVVALLPSVLWCTFAPRLRRHDPQLRRTLVVAVLWGATVATTFSLLAQRYVLPSFFAASGLSASADVVLVAPALEEGLKILFFLVLLRQARVETALEGMIAGAAVGLGFAATENLLSFVATYASAGAHAWLSVVAARTLLTTVMHAVAAAMGGALVGHFAVGPELDRWWFGPATGYLAATLVHTGFNGGLIAAAELGWLAYFAVALATTLAFVAVLPWATRGEVARLLGALLREATQCEMLSAAMVTRTLRGDHGVRQQQAAQALGLACLRAARAAPPQVPARRALVDALCERLAAGDGDDQV